jgi:hypothetical protein
MTVRETLHEMPEHTMDVAQLVTLRDGGGLVLLPDNVSVVNDRLIAGFRPDAQALRVAAREAGVPVELVTPPGAQPGVYSEKAADWVLPVVLAVPGTVVAQLVANELQRRIDRYRHGRAGQMPTARYREVVIDERERVQMREIEGPADDVFDWLRERSGLPPARPGDQVDE